MARPPSRYSYNEEERERWYNVQGDDDDDDDDNGNDPISQGPPTSSPTLGKGNPHNSGKPILAGSPSSTDTSYMAQTTTTTGIAGPGRSKPWLKQSTDLPDTTTYYPSTLVISGHPEQGAVTTVVPTLITSKRNPVLTTPTNVDPDDGNFWEFNEKDEPKNGVKYAAAGIVPVVVLAILGVFIFFCLRKRKRQRAIDAAQAKVQEMKSRSQPFMAAQYGASPSSPVPAPGLQYSLPPPTLQAHYTVPTSHPPSLPGPAMPQPVILGPIAPNSNSAYFTGIDTSDVVSVTDRTGLGDPFADSNSLTEEPPPPYRPRSLAPISRDSSLRIPTAVHSRTNLMAEEQSPFADPVDDDAISVLSGPPRRRQHDAMSVVSDLSYQDEPVVVRRGV